MTDSARDAVRRLLERFSTATLATAGPAGPWAAAVFFASDAELRLYFVSDPNTRHGRDLAADPRVSATVHGDCAAWSEIRGLQIEGTVEILEGAARTLGLECYLGQISRGQGAPRAARDAGRGAHRGASTGREPVSPDPALDPRHR